MQFYKTTSPNFSSINGADLFVMLGLSDLSEEEKDKFIDKIAILAIQYMMQEKLGELLTDEEVDQLEKLPLETPEDLDNMLSVITDMVPDTSNLFLDSLKEIKARLVLEQFEMQKSDLTKLLAEETNPMKKEIISKQLEECILNLVYIERGDWTLINQVDMEMLRSENN